MIRLEVGLEAITRPRPVTSKECQLQQEEESETEYSIPKEFPRFVPGFFCNIEGCTACESIKKIQLDKFIIKSVSVFVVSQVRSRKIK